MTHTMQKRLTIAWVVIGALFVLAFFALMATEIWVDPQVKTWDKFDGRWNYEDPHRFMETAWLVLAAAVAWVGGGFIFYENYPSWLRGSRY